MQVVGDKIVVTLPGYSYAVTYYKPKGSPSLLMRYSVADNDFRLQMTGAEFLAKVGSVPMPRRASCWAGLFSSAWRYH